MEMDQFQKDMRARFEAVRDNARVAARYCESSEFEGCVVYEQLLNLKANVEAAISFYALDVPACDRESIIRMVSKDREDVR